MFFGLVSDKYGRKKNFTHNTIKYFYIFSDQSFLYSLFSVLINPLNKYEHMYVYSFEREGPDIFLLLENAREL